MFVAAEYVKVCNFPEQLRPQGMAEWHSTRRNLWRLWARETLWLADAPALVDSAAYERFCSQHEELSAEHCAAALEYACLVLDHVEEALEKAQVTAHVNLIVDTLLRLADAGALMPLAEVGLKSVSQGPRGREGGHLGGRKPILKRREVKELLALSPAKRRRALEDIAQTAGIRIESAQRRLARARAKARAKTEPA